MTSLGSFSKVGWHTLAPALVALVLSLAENSFAMRCHSCTTRRGELSCEVKECPTTASVKPEEVSMVCLAIYEYEPCDKFCTSLGQMWNKELGGGDRCGGLTKDQLSKLATAEIDRDNKEERFLQKVNETMGGTLKVGEHPTQEQIQRAEEAIKKEEEALARIPSQGRSEEKSEGLYKVCSCSQDLCNSDDLLEKLPNFKEPRNKAASVTPAAGIIAFLILALLDFLV